MKNDIIRALEHRYATVLCAVGKRSPDDAYARAKKVRWPVEEITVDL